MVLLKVGLRELTEKLKDLFRCRLVIELNYSRTHSPLEEKEVRHYVMS